MAVVFFLTLGVKNLIRRNIGIMTTHSIRLPIPVSGTIKEAIAISKVVTYHMHTIVTGISGDVGY
jgi:hypothetical protein